MAGFRLRGDGGFGSGVDAAGRSKAARKQVPACLQDRTAAGGAEAGVRGLEDRGQGPGLSKCPAGARQMMDLDVLL